MRTLVLAVVLLGLVVWTPRTFGQNICGTSVVSHMVSEEGGAIALAGDVACSVFGGEFQIRSLERFPELATIGRVPIPAAFHPVTTISASADLACISTRQGGVLVLDIRTRTAPRVAAVVAASGNVRGAFAYGGSVLACYDTRIDIVQVLGLPSPSVRSTLPIAGANEMAAIGSTVLATSDTGFYTIDMSALSQPRIHSFLNSFPCKSVSVLNGLAVTVGLYQFATWDVRNALTPTLLAELPNYPGLEVRLADQVAYVRYGPRIRPVNISDPTRPTSGGELLNAESTSFIARSAMLAMVNRQTLLTADFSDPSNPRVQRNNGWFEYVNVAAGEGDFVYIVDEFRRLVVVDLSVPSAPRLRGRVDYLGSQNFYDATVEDGVLAVARSDGGLLLFDVRDPNRPTPSGVASLPDSATELVMVRGLIYASALSGGLMIVDARNPNAPALIGRLYQPGLTYSVAAAPPLAYVSSSESRVYVFDVSDPTNPRAVASIPSTNSQQIAAEGRFLYLAGGLVIYDLVAPFAPRRIGAFGTMGRLNDIQVLGTRAFVSLPNQSTISVYDIRDRAHPRLEHSLVGVDTRRLKLTSGPRPLLLTYGSAVEGVTVISPYSPANVTRVLSQPSAAATCLRASTQLSITVDGVRPVSVDWRRDGQVVHRATFASGTGPISSSVRLGELGPLIGGRFDCLVTGSCGEVVSQPAAINPCLADTDDGSASGRCDGGITIDDLAYYLDAYATGNAAADIDNGTATSTPDGAVTIDDLLHYLRSYAAGC